jgi:hypothetical protein
MSLDITLHQPGLAIDTYSSDIFICCEGSIIEISRDEWDKLYPGQEPVKVPELEEKSDIVFGYNITHNLGAMAAAADIYTEIWRPELINATKARQIAPALALGWFKLKRDPEFYKGFNPPNNWGNYDAFLEFVTKYLDARIKYPDAIIEVSR